MKIHEYQGKALFRQFGIPVPDGDVAQTPEQARDIATKLGGVIVVKAQIHAGGRGKGGGVKVCKNPEEAFEAASKILGMQLVTHQTGPEGQKVRTVLVERGSKIARELYLGLVLDRAREEVVVMASTEGGMEIEVVAASTPEKIVKAWASPYTGLQPFQARQLAFSLGLEGTAFKEGVNFILNLYKLFMKKDCSLAEVNPLIVTEDNHVFALDAKLNFDDNATFRQTDVAELRDIHEEDPLEVQANDANLNYVKLDGAVGCMVNGAGLAMATMDLIKYSGSFPANFLDVGGGANQQRVEAAFKILSSDPNVKAVFINIFGGIVRCDMVASGIVAAAKNLNLKLPVVVRLKGTNAEQAKVILEESGLKFQFSADLATAAKWAVEAAEMAA